MRDTALRHWLRGHPDLVDGAVAFVFVIVGFAGLGYRSYAGFTFRPPDAWAILLTVLVAAPLALRRRFPVTVAVIVISAYMTLGFAHYSSTVGGVAALLVIYSVGAHSTAARGLVVTVVATVASLVFLYVRRDVLAPSEITLLFSAGLQIVLNGGTWSLARAMRARRRYLVTLEDRASRLERASSAEVRAALAEERARMARELHDVVAHHVSVMTVQAAAARRTITRAPERSVEAMRAVEETGREALEEMRRIVGALRAVDQDETDGSVQLSPRAGVAELGPLLDRARDAGLQVELTVVGEPRPLTSGVDLAIFRVVQESLTNTLKHAGPTRAAVLLRYEPEAVVVGVTDDGSPRRTPAYRLDDTDRLDHGLGHGLVGMRERVTLNGGNLYTGSRMVGGFEVLATLPLTDAGTPEPDGSTANGVQS